MTTKFTAKRPARKRKAIARPATIGSDGKWHRTGQGVAWPIGTHEV